MCWNFLNFGDDSIGIFSISVTYWYKPNHFPHLIFYNFPSFSRLPQEFHLTFWRVSEVLSDSEGFGRRRKPKTDTRLLSECVSTEAERRVAGDGRIL